MGPKQKYKKWSEEDLSNALPAVKDGMSLNKAQKEFGVPKQTLSDRIRGKYRTTKAGRKTEMTPEEETMLIHYIKYMASIAHPLSISAIKAFAWNIVKRSKRTSSFNRVSGPGHTWWDSFKKRHSREITLRKPDGLDRGRSRMANVTVIKQHFDLLRKTLVDLDILDKPDRIFNCDESGISMDARVGKVVVSRSTKHPYSESKGNRDHITAHVAVSAAGVPLPPMIIFEKAFPSGPYARDGPTNALYAHSPNGYMDIELFKQWCEKLFIPQTRYIQKPILLILNGHGSHLDIEMIDMLVENQIHLYCLPPHTTNILQPLDVSIFKPLKVHFSKITDNLKLATMGHTVPLTVCKTNFTAIFKAAFEGSMGITIIKNGFRKTGICPFNPDAIDKERLMPDNSIDFISSAPNGNNTATSTTPAVPGSSTGASFNSLHGGSFSTPVIPSTDASTPPPSSIATTPTNLLTAASPFTSTPTTPVNPLVAAGIIPVSLVDAFIFPAPKPNKQKNTRIITKSRVLTSDEHQQSFREKVEKKELEEKAKEERKKERERKKLSKEALQSEKKRQKRVMLKTRSVRQKRTMISFESDDSELDDGQENELVEETESEYESSSEEEFERETHCAICKRSNPPVACNKIIWIGCDKCFAWFHGGCSRATKAELSSDTYLCYSCRCE
ncbi:uncharacterized protein LOC130656643 [Hydractinia symbiolongicarpus]|uniref:uncharacterized protein LOC130656643 n=1 Tax=Hydractinia symbiolongicarpus TaxID=13093 RepID=UPI00254C0AA9|nr:uncharacterized protein LOC130656643 [Hydractinia symbiolongicarpus]